MRIDCNDPSTYLGDERQNLRVLLNGERLPFAFAADETQGWAYGWQPDPDRPEHPRNHGPDSFDGMFPVLYTGKVLLVRYDSPLYLSAPVMKCA